MKIVDDIVKWVGFAGAVVGIFWFAIANPEIVNEQFYDAVNRVLPFLMLAFGVMIGWTVRDQMKTRDAETTARIKWEDEEHAEKMRREREERDSEKAAEAKRLEREARMNDAATRFKSYDPSTKVLVCRAYDDGSFVFEYDLSDERDEFSRQAVILTDRETLQDGSFRYTLKPWVREMIGAHPELLDDTRTYMERKRAAKNEEATRVNPELMLPHMSLEELQTLQKIVDNSGYLDLAESGDASYDTLAEFGMIGEWAPDPDGHPICELDKDVLAFFRREENENLIAQYISYAMEDGARSA